MVTTSALTAVENKIPDVSNLVKKKKKKKKRKHIIMQKLINWKKKLTDHNHDKYIIIISHNLISLQQKLLMQD